MRSCLSEFCLTEASSVMTITVTESLMSQIIYHDSIDSIGEDPVNPV